MNVRLLIPENNAKVDIDGLIAGPFSAASALPAFSEVSIGFLAEISRSLLAKKGIKNYQELVALAYWLRPGNIRRIADSFLEQIKEDEIIVPRGMAFHIAPSNVDSIFLYSWALSLLCGNKNIVRLSENISEQIKILIDVAAEILQDVRWAKIRTGNLIVTYPRDNEINKIISSLSDLRIIWGGDETVGNIRSLPAKPAAKDITFADKFSYTVIDADEYLGLNEEGKAKLAHAFYNDSYWFDQMACSSPRFVYIVGPQKSRQKTSELFWKFLNEELKTRNITSPIEQSMEKLIFKYGLMAEDNVETISDVSAGDPTVMRIGKESIRGISEYCGGGFFIECFLEGLHELSGLVEHKDQTLTYFGFEKTALKKLALEINGKGIDRIVPVGEAMNFSQNWDGYSLLYELTKKVIIN